MIVKYQASPVAAYDHKWPTAPEEIRRVTEWFANGDSYLAVCRRESEGGGFIGFVALNPDKTPPLPAYNLGYVFDEAYHGRGYATEACHAALRRAFDDLHAAQVVSGTHRANAPSVKLLRRLGFREVAGREGFHVLPRQTWEAARPAHPDR